MIDIYMKRMMENQLPSNIDETDLPEPRSQGAQLLARYCVQRHDLPLPVLHTSTEWPKALERIERRVGSILNQTPGSVSHPEISAAALH